jgi:DNA-binding beta-propeller fold protein YncE
MGEKQGMSMGVNEMSNTRFTDGNRGWVWPLLALGLVFVSAASAADRQPDERRLLYVASPGVRNYVEYGGHGVLVFDIDDGHKLLRRIPMGGLDEEGKPLNVKGICASAKTKRLYVSTLRDLICIDLVTDQQLWEREYEGGCDRMAISPDGSLIYLPTLEQDHWKVVDAESGEEVARVTPDSGSHNTVYGSDGRFAYLAGLRSPLLTVAETGNHTAARTVGPFSNSIRPFTVNAAQTLCFVCLNELLGFEIGDIQSGKKLMRVEVAGYEKGPVKRHGCPSHGIGLTPDETEVWVADATNQCVHIFDIRELPPKQVESIKLRDEPGWVTFTIDGTLAYPSTGEVIDTSTRQIVATLTDEEGRPVMSEKMLEIDFRGNEPIRNGDQFGVGRVGIAHH